MQRGTLTGSRRGRIPETRAKHELESAAPAPHINLGEAGSLRSRDPGDSFGEPCCQANHISHLQDKRASGIHTAAFSPPQKGDGAHGDGYLAAAKPTQGTSLCVDDQQKCSCGASAAHMVTVPLCRLRGSSLNASCASHCGSING